MNTTSQYIVGDTVRVGIYGPTDIYKITKVRFDSLKNPIYTAVNNLGHVLLRDCEISGKVVGFNAEK